MAVTGFWPIKRNLKAALDYADNPDKTTPREYLDEDLYAALRYAENDDKTERQMFVGGINCSKQNAYAEMIAVQRRFGLRGKVLGYHGIQSFRAGEVTPEEAFAIGKETARRMWGDKYQVLVTVHLNTDNVHCHFVVNPVSFKDGMKFQNKIGDHKELRRVSDAICREHGLSVLENSDFYGSRKKEYWRNKSGKQSHRDILRQDIEYCLAYAGNMRGFISQLQGLGYKYDWQRGSVKAPGWERAVRLKNLGYTPDRITERLDSNLFSKDYLYQWNTHLPYHPKRYPLLELEKQLQFSVEHSHDTATVLVDAIFLIIVMLLQPQVEDTPVMPLSPAVRQELSRLDELQKEYLFLSRHEIHTAKDLTETIVTTSRQIEEKEAQRQKYRNQLRRIDDPEWEKELKEQAKAISAELKLLREDLQTAKRIEERYPVLQQLLETERDMENRARAREERNCER